MGRLVRVCLREIAAVGLRLTIYLGIFGLIAVLVVQLLSAAQSLALAPASGKPEWVADERPNAAFALSLPDMPHPIYRVLRDASGARRDVIVAENEGRSVLLEIYRPAGPFVAGSLVGELAGRASEIGRVENIEAAPAIATRFGELALADFTLVSDGRRRGCLGFLRLVQDPALQISGWVCQAGPGMVARTAVTCAFDRLTLLSAGNDSRLAHFFAQAELKGSHCLQKRTKAGAAHPRDWIDGRQALRLRGSAR